MEDVHTFNGDKVKESQLGVLFYNTLAGLSLIRQETNDRQHPTSNQPRPQKNVSVS